MKKQRVILLHGWSLDNQIQQKWQPFCDALERLNLDPELLILPGFADTPITEPWTLDMYVSWVLQQLPNKQPVVVLGHSFGGQLAIRLAAEHPDRVSQLILIGAAGIRSQSVLAKLKRSTWKTVAKVGRAITQSERARHALYALVGERDYLRSSPLMRQTMSNVLAQDTQDDAARITAPTLLIWGEFDSTTPLWIARRYQRLIAGSQLELIHQARHAPHFSHVDATTLCVGAFLGTR